MTDEQLEKQISEEFEKWIKGMDFHCQWEAENHLISLDAYFNYVADVAFKAAALPLMRKIKEIQYEANESMVSYQNSLAKTYTDTITKLQKENAELKKIDLHSALERIKDLDKYIGELREALDWLCHEFIPSRAYQQSKMKEIRTKLNLDTNDKGAV